MKRPELPENASRFARADTDEEEGFPVDLSADVASHDAESTTWNWAPYGTSITITGKEWDEAGNKIPSQISEEFTAKLKREQEIALCEMAWLCTGVEPKADIKEEIERRREANRQAQIEEEAKDYWWDGLTPERREACIALYKGTLDDGEGVQEDP